MTHLGLTNCTQGSNATEEKCIWEKEKTERSEKIVERCFIFMRAASENVALALKSTTTRKTKGECVQLRDTLQ